MTEATARREARAGDAAGHCGFCGARGKPGERIVHKRSCKLVCEHGGRIRLLAEPAGTAQP